MLGILEIPVFPDLHFGGFVIKSRKFFAVCGGPYKQKPTEMPGVKMAKEISLFKNGTYEIDIPTRDFHTPDPDDLARGLEAAVFMITSGSPLYVGCYAGKGRTGLFMAVLVKAFGIKDPVAFVRAKYYPHAVETEDQKKFVADFEIPWTVKKMIFKARWASWFRPSGALND
jgi:hypothetical protein